MQYQRTKLGYVVKLEPGEDFFEQITKLFSKASLKSHSIEAIGSIKDPTLAYYDLEKKQFLKKTFKGNFELLSCLGTVGFDNYVPLIHAHAVLSDKKFQTIGGHVIKLTTYATVEIVLSALDTNLLKSYNNETGLKIFDLECTL